jgi:hypothetical protein
MINPFSGRENSSKGPKKKAGYPKNSEFKISEYKVDQVGPKDADNHNFTSLTLNLWA